MDFESIHPGKEEYLRYLQGSLADEKKLSLELHLAICDFCSELLANLTLQQKLDSETDTVEIPNSIKELADKLFSQSMRGKLISLKPFKEPAAGPSITMAADGEKQSKQAIESLGTVYSENPEIVLRLMRDNKLNQHYLQVVSDDPNLFENVLVEAPEIGKSVVTNKSGRADLDAIRVESLSDLHWQIRLPEAVFELQQFNFDPESTEYHRETILDSEHGDRIRITLEGKGEGKQIELEILKLDGSTDIGPMQIVVSLDNEIKIFELNSQHKLIIDDNSRHRTLRVRLYT